MNGKCPQERVAELREDPSFFPSTHIRWFITAGDSNYRGSDAPDTCVEPRYPCRTTPMDIKKIFLFKNNRKKLLKKDVFTVFDTLKTTQKNLLGADDIVPAA